MSLDIVNRQCESSVALRRVVAEAKEELNRAKLQIKELEKTVRPFERATHD